MGARTFRRNMGNGDHHSIAMKKTLHILFGVLLLSGCYKDDINLDELNNNPFDRDYEGPAMFELIGTYVELVTISGSTVQQQVIEFRVREENFLSPASYSVHLKDPALGTSHLLQPDPPLSDHFKYYRLAAVAEGQEICLELRLSNNQSTAGMEVICATL